MDGSANGQITVAFISALAAVAVAAIGLLASRLRDQPDRRSSRRNVDGDGLLTVLVNDLRRENAALRKENHRLRAALEERGWSG